MNRWAYDVASEQIKSLHEEARTATLVPFDGASADGKAAHHLGTPTRPLAETDDLPAYSQH